MKGTVRGDKGLDLAMGLDAREEWIQRRRVAGNAQRVGIGEFATTDGAVSLRATLGSCVGVCLAHPKTGRFALAHVLLPTSAGSGSEGRSAARCADTVVPLLLDELGIREDRRHEVTAFIAGGAALYAGNAQRNEVGKDNGRMLVEQLRAHKIRIAGRDLGGKASRQIVVDGAAGQVYTLVLDERDQGVAWPPPVSRAA